MEAAVAAKPLISLETYRADFERRLAAAQAAEKPKASFLGELTNSVGKSLRERRHFYLAGTEKIRDQVFQASRLSNPLLTKQELANQVAGKMVKESNGGTQQNSRSLLGKVGAIAGVGSLATLYLWIGYSVVQHWQERRAERATQALAAQIQPTVEAVLEPVQQIEETVDPIIEARYADVEETGGSSLAKSEGKPEEWDMSITENGLAISHPKYLLHHARTRLIRGNCVVDSIDPKLGGQEGEVIGFIVKTDPNCAPAEAALVLKPRVAYKNYPLPEIPKGEVYWKN